MAESQTMVDEVQTAQLRLASGQGPVTRTVLQTLPRDALPSEIPVIDISGIFSSSIDDRRATARQIRDAAMNTGFFYISNHGVSETVIENTYKAALAFFRQDLQTKLRAKIAPTRGYPSGYRPFASQQVNPDDGPDHREAFSWAYDPTYDPDMDETNPVPEHARESIKADEHPWHAAPCMPQLKAALVPYFQSCLRLARALTRSFALSLELPEDYFDPKVKPPDVTMLLNYYPQKEAPSSAEAQKQVAMGAHTDFRLFTILWQDSTGGLQILNRDGQWLNGPPVPGTFVVNIADFMQRITNGRYMSTVHRVQRQGGGERLSVPFFWGFGARERCGVLESCVGEGEERMYDDVGAQEYVDRRLRQLNFGRNEVDRGESG